jgi:chorismate mutase/prephenate dehydratase
VLSNSETEPTGNDKTSILIYTENKPGALFRILEPFENLRISLTKIETRPSKKEAWAYVFFIDFEGHIKDANVQNLFNRLNASTAEIKVLGSYSISLS